MMDALLDEAVRLPLPGAEVMYHPQLDLGQPPDAVRDALIAQLPWRQDSIRLWGKVHAQPRLTAWVGDTDARYRYSGLMLEPLPWTPLLIDLKQRAEAASGHGFNSVLLNLYRDGQDSMGWHSDDERELGPCPVIASLSLGAERVMQFKARGDGVARASSFTLENGSLLVMRGETQARYKHAIPKTRKPVKARINLTFRTIFA